MQSFFFIRTKARALVWIGDYETQEEGKEIAQQAKGLWARVHVCSAAAPSFLLSVLDSSALSF